MKKIEILEKTIEDVRRYALTKLDSLTHKDLLEMRREILAGIEEDKLYGEFK